MIVWNPVGHPIFNAVGHPLEEPPKQETGTPATVVFNTDSVTFDGDADVTFGTE